MFIYNKKCFYERRNKSINRSLKDIISNDNSNLLRFAYGLRYYYIKNINDFKGTDGKKEIEKCITLKKELSGKEERNGHTYTYYRTHISVNQIDKYCIICDMEKPIEKFTNKTNKKLIEMSDMEYNIFTVCNDCEYLIKNTIEYIYEHEFHDRPINVIKSKLFKKYETINNTYFIKTTICKVMSKTVYTNFAHLYFIIKCKTNKHIAQYIYSFIELPQVWINITH